MKALIFALIYVTMFTVPAFAQTVPILDDDTRTVLISPIPIEAGKDTARVVLDSKQQLRGSDAIDVVLRLSLNGGMTDQPAGGATFHAGNQPRDFIVPLAQPGAPSGARVLGGWITIQGKWKGAAWVEID